MRSSSVKYRLRSDQNIDIEGSATEALLEGSGKMVLSSRIRHARSDDQNAFMDDASVGVMSILAWFQFTIIRRRLPEPGKL